MTAPATFLGVQPGCGNLPAIELFNLLAPVGVYPTGSTVSRQTLERHGYSIVPARRPAATRQPDGDCVLSQFEVAAPGGGLCVA